MSRDYMAVEGCLVPTEGAPTTSCGDRKLVLSLWPVAATALRAGAMTKQALLVL
jgi:hypothetical protein